LGKALLGVGYGRWSIGDITDEIVNEYLEHHRRPEDGEGSNFIIEK
jgi:putative transposase